MHCVRLLHAVFVYPCNQQCEFFSLSNVRMKLADEHEVAKLAYNALTENHHRNPEPLLLQENRFNQVKRRFNMSTKSSRKLPSTSHEPVLPPQSTTTSVPPQFTTSVHPQFTTSMSPPSTTTSVPPQFTTSMPPQSISVPPQSTTFVPPQSTTFVPPQSTTTSVPPQFTTSMPPQSTTSVPPQFTTSVPPQFTTSVPPQSTTTSVPPQSTTSMPHQSKMTFVPPPSPATPLTSKIHFSSSAVLKWKELPLALKTVVQIKSQYTYIVEEYNTLNRDDFIGAPEHNFTVTLRINIKEEKHFKEWLQEMFEHSKCTYRTTRTYNVRQKRILYRVDMHCQHKQKILTARQKGLRAASKKKPNPLMGELRNKKTNCPSTLILKLEEPTRKELNSDKKDLFMSHKAKLQLKFNHNHPIHSAHVLSFRPVNEQTKEKYHKLFQSGHSAETIL